MRTKLEKILLILGGAIVGIFISINLPVFADKTKSTNLPIDELRTFAEVFGKIKSDYVETIEDKNGALPLLAPMSEVAGRLAGQQAAKYLEKPQGGSGILVGGVTGVAPAKALVLGGGVVGTNAAAVLVGMGAIVMDGVVVESNSIIAAGAVVTKNTHVESGTIYAGVPAKKIKNISNEMISGEIDRIANNYVEYSSWFKK